MDMEGSITGLSLMSEETDLAKICTREGDVKGRLAFGDGSEMGGLKRTFYCTTLEKPQGDLDLLNVGFAAMGGSDVAKFILSPGPEGVAIMCNVPAEFQTDTDIEDSKDVTRTRKAMFADKWVEAVLSKLEATSISCQPGSSNDLARACVPNQPDSDSSELVKDAQNHAEIMLEEHRCFAEGSDSGSDIAAVCLDASDDY